MTIYLHYLLIINSRIFLFNVIAHIGIIIMYIDVRVK